LGETYAADFEDGTQYRAEQTSHHPPISHFMFIGPDKRFVYTGYGSFTTNTGMNSITINVSGERKIVFDDGQVIIFQNSTVSISEIVGIV